MLVAALCDEPSPLLLTMCHCPTEVAVRLRIVGSEGARATLRGGIPGRDDTVLIDEGERGVE